MRRINKTIYGVFKYAAVAGNVSFVLWMLYNGIEESGSGQATIYQIISYIGLFLLLTLNSILLFLK